MGGGCFRKDFFGGPGHACEGPNPNRFCLFLAQGDQRSSHSVPPRVAEKSAELRLNPDMIWFDNNQYQWAAYLRGDLTDETRVNTPLICLNTTMVMDGIFMSDKLGRSVTAEEIDALSESTALRRQVTPWGVFEYDF